MPRFFKFVLILGVANIVLVALIHWIGVSISWVISVEVVGFVGYILWTTWTHPAQQLANQAADMNWEALSSDKDSGGRRDVLLRKAGVIAKISYQQQCISIVDPCNAGPFKDFFEVERFMQLRG